MLQIQSHSHPYQVVEHNDLASALEDLAAAPSSLFLIDRKVAGLYRDSLFPRISEDRAFLIEANEVSKTYEQLPPAFCWLLERRCQRSSNLVVIGGGVLQDIGCFIASVLFRGIRWTLLPTTLLAQCDSCIGSKSSLNIAHFKNQLGTFYSPHEVRLVPAVLQTLSPDEIRSGLGEAAKIHFVDGPESVVRLRQDLERWPADQAALSRIVWSSLSIKKRFIEADEFDRGVRNMLNFGHTFAHAFESATHYAIPHGIAVTLGVSLATHFSERLGMLAPNASAELRAWLRPLFVGYEDVARGADREAVVAAMQQDKKNRGDGITFILSRGPGQMEKTVLAVGEARTLLAECLNTL